MGANVTNIGENAFNAVSGDVFILKPAHENFDINNFSSMANVYACDSLDDAGVHKVVKMHGLMMVLMFLNGQSIFVIMILIA